MNAPLERIARAYRPLYPRTTLVEGGWMHRQPPPPAQPAPRRFILLAWVAAVMPQYDRRRR